MSLQSETGGERLEPAPARPNGSRFRVQLPTLAAYAVLAAAAVVLFLATS